MSFSFVSTEGGTEGFIKTGHLNLSGVLPAAAPEKKKPAKPTSLPPMAPPLYQVASKDLDFGIPKEDAFFNSLAPTCPICLESIDMCPMRTLPCGHSVCVPCLTRLIDTFKNDELQNAGTSRASGFNLCDPPLANLACPTCRRTFDESAIADTHCPSELPHCPSLLPLPATTTTTFTPPTFGPVTAAPVPVTFAPPTLGTVTATPVPGGTFADIDDHLDFSIQMGSPIRSSEVGLAAVELGVQPAAVEASVHGSTEAESQWGSRDSSRPSSSFHRPTASPVGLMGLSSTTTTTAATITTAATTTTDTLPPLKKSTYPPKMMVGRGVRGSYIKTEEEATKVLDDALAEPGSVTKKRVDKALLVLKLDSLATYSDHLLTPLKALSPHMKSVASSGSSSPHPSQATNLINAYKKDIDELRKDLANERKDHAEIRTQLSETSHELAETRKLLFESRANAIAKADFAAIMVTQSDRQAQEIREMRMASDALAGMLGARLQTAFETGFSQAGALAKQNAKQKKKRHRGTDSDE